MSKTYETILVDIKDGIATLTFNRPDALNALSTRLVLETQEALADLRQNDHVRVLVLTGNGRAFCAGADLKDPIMSTDKPRHERGQSFKRIMDSMMNAMLRDIYNFDRPKIAAVNGPAVGGGVGIALAADIVVAAESAYFMQMFAPKLNLVPDLGVSWHLPRLVGRARAIGLTLLGDKLPAKTALEWGLIWDCVEDAKLRSEVADIAARLSAGPPRALGMTSKVMDAALGQGFVAQLDLERDMQSSLVETEDFAEAVQSFIEKRAPEFTGR
jgi:2-(1,2-epoxy-1,2-dihydrophenyl)acetyl-CoA isomerase